MTDRLGTRSSLTLIAGGFGYTLAVGLLVQLVLLPHLFSGWHAGHGLLATCDYSRFHDIASRLSDEIHRQGWSAWVLPPDGQPVAGIAAVFYTLIVPEPWTVLPLNAALHAVGGWSLFVAFHLVTRKSRYAVAAPL